MPTLRYALPDACANTPVTAADGSIWVNHFSGLFRCHQGEVFPILRYQDGGITWVYSAPLNKHYSHGTAYLPSPVVFGDRVYVCCRDGSGETSDVRRKTSYILCYSSGGTLLWKLTVNGSCTHLISTAAGVFETRSDGSGMPSSKAPSRCFPPVRSLAIMLRGIDVSSSFTWGSKSGCCRYPALWN